MKSLLLMSLFIVAVAWSASSSRAQEPTPEPAEEADSPGGRPTVPLTVEDLWAMERLSAPAVSPDGRWIVFGVTAYSYDENKGESDLWRVSADGSSPLCA